MTVTSETTTGITSETETNWRETLPEVLQEAPWLKNAESPEQWLQELKNASHWQGNSVLKPGANASDEAKAANQAKVRELYPELMPVPDPYSDEAGDVFVKMGRPDSADKYKMPEGFEIDDGESAILKALALDSNMTQAQFEKYQAGIMGKRQEAYELAKGERDAGMSAWKEQLGATYEASMKDINTMLANDKRVPSHIKAAHEAGNLDAETYQWLDSIVKQGEEQPQALAQEGQTHAMTPEQAKQEASELRERLFKMTDMDAMKPILMKKLLEAEAYSLGRQPL